MGASVIGYCKNLTEKLEEGQPGFWNDCKAWGDWMAIRYDYPEVLTILQELNCEALLSHTTEGKSDDEIDWISPIELKEAALELRKLVLDNDSRIKPILDSYEKNAINFDSITKEFAQDLIDVASIAEFFEDENIPKMTLEVNW